MSDSCPLVSVIIPVYNNRDYIEACILSVVNQAYPNLEIIMVDDGSTDDGYLFIEKYASSDPRIIPIRRSNGGPFLARWSGLAVAKGKYIQYLDGDDTLLDDAIGLLVRKAEGRNADIVAAPFYFCCPDRAPQLSAVPGFDELKGTDYLNEIFNGRAYWSMCSNFQKRSLFDENNMKKVSHIYYGEDAIFMIQLLVRDPKVVAFDKPVFNYNRNAASITGNIDDDKYRNFRAYQKWLEDFFKMTGLDGKFRKGMALLHIRTTFDSIYWNHLEDARRDMEKVIADLKQYPELDRVLTRRQRKILFVYRISACLGYLNLVRYKKQGKV